MHTPSRVLAMRHILLTKGLLQAHSDRDHRIPRHDEHYFIILVITYSSLKQTHQTCKTSIIKHIRAAQNSTKNCALEHAKKQLGLQFALITSYQTKGQKPIK